MAIINRPEQELHMTHLRPILRARTTSQGLITALGLAALAAIPLTANAYADAVPGKLAPEFTAIDSNGKSHKLSDFKGKTVVLEWTNDGCPYVRKHYSSGNMQAIQQDATDKGVVWLSVISSAKGEQGFVDGVGANKLTVDRKAKPTAVLLDPEGTVGRAYGAKTTPHMYIIDGSGKLVYNGAIDDKPTSNVTDIKSARPYVKEALAAVAEGKAVAIAATRAYGCSVKYQ